jgi:hypothetical protein
MTYDNVSPFAIVLKLSIQKKLRDLLFKKDLANKHDILVRK